MCSHPSPACVPLKEIDIFPGQTFQVEAVAVGQRYGIVPSIVTAELLESHSDSHLEQGQDVQSVGRECTKLYYTMYSNKKVESIQLTVAVPLIETLYQTNIIILDYLPQQYHNLFEHLIIKINLKDCLLGFVFDDNRQTCFCSPKLISITEYFVTLKSTKSRRASICGFQYQLNIYSSQQPWSNNS